MVTGYMRSIIELSSILDRSTVDGVNRMGQMSWIQANMLNWRDLRKPLRRSADVDVRAGRNSRNRASESQEGNSLSLKESDQHFSLRAVWMEGHVYRVAVIPAQPVMRRRLSDRAGWQRAPESRTEETLNSREMRD